MANLTQVILISLAGGTLSLIGGFILLSRKNAAFKLAQYATPFAAGALLSAAFLDLLNESAELGAIQQGLIGALGGMLIFFLLERSLDWFHHHHEHEDSMDPAVPLIVIGDTLHNFIDGIAIGSALLVDPTSGIVAASAVAAHEIPQEVGDFGLLLKKGMKPRTVIIINILSALATVFAAVLIWWLGQTITLPMGYLLGLVAGFFIYIAASDIIPTIHETEQSTLAWQQTILLLFGVLVVGIITTQVHSLSHDENHEAEHSLMEYNIKTPHKL